jgi:hypothetical protein
LKAECSHGQFFLLLPHYAVNNPEERFFLKTNGSKYSLMKKQSSQFFRSIFFSIFLLSCLAGFTQNPGPLITDTVTFRVNMEYMITSGTFNPATDTVDIAGSMNQWNGGDFLQQVDTTSVYEIRMELVHGAIYSYKFRIHKTDTILAEQADTTTRLLRVPDTAFVVTNFFSNVNPAVVPMTFNCNLYYQIQAGHFTSNIDFVDVAGNFNNEGGNDVLFNLGNDSIFSLTKFMDTTLIGTTLRFKFRFNGNWETAELQGDSSRLYILTGSADSFTAWYNNIDPSVPSLPFVYDLNIQDTLHPVRTVSGSYRYEDYNLRPEGNSIYRWYTADTIGGAVTAIDSAFQIAYTIDSAYIGKFLVFEVTPMTQDSVVGLPVRVYSTVVVSYVGLNEKGMQWVRIYPNPVTEILYIEPLKSLEQIELLNTSGKTIMTISGHRNNTIQMNVGDLPKGLYFLRVRDINSKASTLKVIIQ